MMVAQSSAGVATGAARSSINSSEVAFNVPGTAIRGPLSVVAAVNLNANTQHVVSFVRVELTAGGLWGHGTEG